MSKIYRFDEALNDLYSLLVNGKDRDEIFKALYSCSVYFDRRAVEEPPHEGSSLNPTDRGELKLENHMDALKYIVISGGKIRDPYGEPGKDTLKNKDGGEVIIPPRNLEVLVAFIDTAYKDGTNPFPYQGPVASKHFSSKKFPEREAKIKQQEPAIKKHEEKARDEAQELYTEKFAGDTKYQEAANKYRQNPTRSFGM